MTTISIAAGNRHVMVYLPDNTYKKIEPHSQASVEMSGDGPVAVVHVGDEEEPPTGDDVKAFFIKVFQAVRDHIEELPPPQKA